MKRSLIAKRVLRESYGPLVDKRASRNDTQEISARLCACTQVHPISFELAIFRAHAAEACLDDVLIIHSDAR